MVDENRAREVFGILLDAMLRKDPPYDGITPVSGEGILPEGMEWQSREHAIFLFSGCFYMKGKINSDTAFRALGNLYSKHKWMFYPEEFVALNGKKERRRKQIGRLLSANGLGFDSSEISRFWVANFHKLGEYWDGHPANLYKGVETYDEVCRVLIRKGQFREDAPHGFYGFRHKMASMLTYFYSDAGFVNPILFPVPVDFHILRVLVATGVLFVPNMGPGARLSVDALSATARRVTIEYCAETSTDPLRLADALWHLSRELCRMTPGNRSSVGRYHGRKTGISDLSPSFWTSGEERSFHKSCGICSVSEHCGWNIPSSNYYVQGVIKVRSPRAKPLDLFVK